MSQPGTPREAFPLPPGCAEGHADVNGVRLHYVAAGAEGPLVLLLHGFPEFWYSWRQQLPTLGARCRAVAPDLRGYNLSGKPPRGYDLRTLCADVAGLIEALGAQEAAIVGHDWGGVIAWAFALREPARTTRLAILDAPHPAAMARELRRPRQLLRSSYVAFFQIPRLPEWAIARRDYALLRRVLAAADHEAARRGRAIFTPDDIERYVAAIARPGALGAALGYYRALVRGGPAAFGPARRIEAPTLVLWGDRDPYLGTELLDGLDRWVGDLQVRRFTDAGHWLNQELPAEVNAALLDFLGGEEGMA